MANTAYIPTQWVDHFEDPQTGTVLQQGTDVNAENLNNMETGISAANTKADSLELAVSGHISNAGLHTSAAEKAATANAIANNTDAITKTAQNLTAHASNAAHVTAAEKTTWNSGVGTANSAWNIANNAMPKTGGVFTGHVGASMGENHFEMLRNTVVMEAGTTNFVNIGNCTLIFVKK